MLHAKETGICSGGLFLWLMCTFTFPFYKSYCQLIAKITNSKKLSLQIRITLEMPPWVKSATDQTKQKRHQKKLPTSMTDPVHLR